jgi:hypothetical protein
MRQSSTVTTQKYYTALQSETIQIEHELHSKRLSQVRPMMKIDRPVTPSHLVNKKKALLARQRDLEEIQRKNRILYEKMAYMRPSKK